jgi:hypothetical protein
MQHQRFASFRCGLMDAWKGRSIAVEVDSGVHGRNPFSPYRPGGMEHG